ncbi:uncharacterized protein [Lepeophtheirus salmonis]|uniref:uncharacterized protein n=1 Tax=Lepeophtheirus salmonis TaxID=72036 RepID=UPI001AE2FA06|nr:uncharacterized protein LOC121124329 [Lepeophtheirus salmonis]
MPNGCVAPGCTVGQPRKIKPPHVTIHRFPNNPTRRLKWIAAIKKVRNNWDYPESSKTIVVLCSLHFQPGDFTYESKDSNPSRKKMKINDGKVKKRRLKEDAVPSIYSNLPSSMNNLKNSLLKEGSIFLPSGFNVLQINEDKIDVLKFCEGETGLPVVERGITIHEDQSFKAFLHGYIVPADRFKHLVKNDGILTETLQIQNILSLLDSIETDEDESSIKEALYNLQEKVEEAVLPEENKMKLEFAIEQGYLAIFGI